MGGTITIIIGVMSGILLLLLLLLCVVSYFLARHVAHPNTITIEDEIKYEEEHGMWKDFPSLPQEEFLLPSYDGYELHGVYVPAKDSSSNHYVVISHGYSGCRFGSVKYLHMFHDFGFHCIIYDDRGHGSNKKAPCTMGAKESRDLIEVINYTYERFGKDICLGLHGESMGAGLGINALKYHPRVQFIVNDCGYNNLTKLLSGMITRYIHLPGFLIYPASVASKIFYGYAFSEVMPIANLSDNDIPICFIHGAEDDFIFPEHAKEMYEANKSYCELHIIPKAGHAESIIVDEAAYRKIVSNFLTKINIMEEQK